MLSLGFPGEVVLPSHLSSGSKPRNCFMSALSLASVYQLLQYPGA